MQNYLKEHLFVALKLPNKTPYVTFEERASCTFDFNISIVEVETYTSTPINTINITSTIYDQTPLGTTPVVITSKVEDPTPSIPPD